MNLSKRLSDILGFVKTGPFGAGDKKSEYPVEDGTDNLYVYCDLIEPVALGNAKVPLLRIVLIQKGPIVTTSYNQVFYYPVIRKIFGVVEINIKRDTGEIIPFVCAKSFVALHFSSKMRHQDYCCDNSTCQAYEQYYTSHGLGCLFWGLIGVAAPLLKKGAIALGKSLGRKALKAGVELAQDYLGDNKRSNNQRKRVISLRAVKRG